MRLSSQPPSLPPVSHTVNHSHALSQRICVADTHTELVADCAPLQVEVLRVAQRSGCQGEDHRSEKSSHPRSSPSMTLVCVLDPEREYRPSHLSSSSRFPRIAGAPHPSKTT